MGRSKRLFSGLGVVAMLATCLVLTSGPVQAAGCNKPGQIINRGRGWSTIKRPEFVAPVNSVTFATGADDIKAMSIDPSDPSRIYASSYYSVERSNDGGCTWQRVFELGAEPTPDIPFTQLNAQIRGVVLPGSKKHANRIYVTLSGAGGTNVLRSDDGGKTWKLKTSGLVPHRCQVDLFYPGISIAPSDTDVVYLGCVLTQGTGTVAPGNGLPAIGGQSIKLRYLFRSDDGGDTWTLRSDAASELEVHTTPTGEARMLVTVDPLDPNDIWVSDTVSVRHSTDGGKTLTKVNGLRHSAGEGAFRIAIFHSKGSDARLVMLPYKGAQDPAPRFVLRSDNGGKTWYQQASPLNPMYADFGGSPNSLVLGTVSQDGTVRFDPRLARSKSSVPYVSLPPEGFQYHPTVIPGAGRGKSTVYGFSNDAIERFVGKV